MSRSNYDKPFYVYAGTSVVAIRCASNHDTIVEYAYGVHPPILQFAKKLCDRMNKEAEIGRPRRNCDVGTAEDQYNRFVYCCTSHKISCRRSYAFGCVDCYAKWSQLPYEKYEEGDAK